MSDFNFSYSIGSPPSTAGTQRPLYSFNSAKVLPCAGNTVTLHHTQTHRGMLVQSEVAQALSFCTPFRTMEAHLDQILTAMPPLRGNPEDAHNILAGIRDAGFLESADDAWRRLTVGAEDRQIAPARLFILTCDRPSALERLLNNLVEVGVDPAIESVWVIDDSRQTSAKQQNAEIVSAFTHRTAVPLHHVNDEMQQKLFDHLKQALPQHEASLFFLLDAQAWPNTATYGRARNVSLLLSAGFRALVLDDDIVLQAIAPPFAQRELKLSAASDREAQFYAEQEALDRHALDMGASPLTLMLNNIGETLGGLVSAQLSGPRALAGWDGEVLSRHTASSPILLHQCGTWGDPGTGDGSWIFFLPPSSIKTLMASDHQVDRLLEAQSSWLGYRGPTLTPYGVMAGLTGLNHKTLLPPYFPAGRGEDILFGIMLQRLHPESLVLSEGWAIRHEPVENRQDRGELNPLAVSPGLHTLADWLGQEPEAQWGLTPRRRLENLSNEVRALSEMSEESLERLVGARLASKRTSLLARCLAHSEHLDSLEHSQNTEKWSHFLTETQSGLIEAMQKQETAPLDSAMSNSDRADWHWLRDTGIRLADSLTAWTEICEAARGFEP